jgi:hypothetical protein
LNNKRMDCGVTEKEPQKGTKLQWHRCHPLSLFAQFQQLHVWHNIPPWSDVIVFIYFYAR